MKRLKKKVYGYNAQDKKSGRVNFIEKYDDYFPALLQLESIITLIEKNGLSCHYCNDVVNIIPINKKNQMTLDRIDNKQSHHIDNCVIACYDCNITRGNIVSSDRFMEIKTYAR